MNLTTETDIRRLRANKLLDPKRKSNLGQFFTPAPISQFMASLFTKIEGEIRMLDSGTGVGSMIAAFIEEAIKRGSAESIHVTGYEIEPIVVPFLEQTLSSCQYYLLEKKIPFTSEFLKEDFILSATQDLEPNLFKKTRSYSHVLINPPYKKLSSASDHRHAMRRVGIETVNLYTAFLALAIKQLKNKGELVAIVPRSFCNGTYYQPFRQFLLKETAIQQIHIFDSRTTAFSEDNVLQENIIIHCIKGGKVDKVKVTSSPSADFIWDDEYQEYTSPDMTSRYMEPENLVRPEDPQKFIHITATSREEKIKEYLKSFNFSLKELNIEVSTGPVVGFRLKNELLNNYELGAAPLLYPIHLNGSVEHPKVSKKPNAIRVTDQSKKWLWKNEGSFVLTRRFSSKEEKKRIVATLYDSSLEGELVGFENKLNVFHNNKKGIDSNIARGLYAYLNSTLLDNYYRQISGHTQVNATDLKTIKYPSLEALKRIGIKVNQIPLAQNEIDRLIENEIKSMSGINAPNPLEAQSKIDQALGVLRILGLPNAQLNERSALTFLALLNLKPEGNWQEIERPLLGVTPIMDWCREFYGKEYAPNTRETFRRQTLHQFRDAGIVLYNPDDPARAVNSPKACYQIAPELHLVLLSYGTPEWNERIEEYRSLRETLVEQYAKERVMHLIPLQMSDGVEIQLSSGAHSQLIRDIVKEFGPRFAPGSEVIYIGDTAGKNDFLKQDRLEELGVVVDSHGKMPDVVLYYPAKDWILLIESVTSHGPVDGKRHAELAELFASVKDKLVYVTAFPDRRIMGRYLSEISWETEVWVADAPTHLIHFNGERFLGPYI